MDESNLMSVATRLEKNKWGSAHRATNISKELRDTIEQRLRKGHAITQIAREEHTSPSTVIAIREQMQEADPEFYRTSTVGQLKRITKRGLDTIEETFEVMQQEGVEPKNLMALSVSLGILMDKCANLSGDAPATVVEHRLKLDASQVNALIASKRPATEVEVIDVTPVQAVA